jgi:hypothetical protein
MLETHIVMSSLMFRLILTLMLRLTHLLVLCLVSLMDLTITHMVLVDIPRPHRGDHFPRRRGFPAGGSYTHFEPRHLDGPCFPHRGSRPTSSKGEVQKTAKTSSCRIVKCWIPKIYLTNPNTESSTSSCPM